MRIRLTAKRTLIYSAIAAVTTAVAAGCFFALAIISAVSSIDQNSPTVHEAEHLTGQAFVALIVSAGLCGIFVVIALCSGGVLIYRAINAKKQTKI